MTYFISPPFGNYLDFKNSTSIKGSFTLLSRPGLISQVIFTLRYSFINEGWINKIGLRNPGIDYAIKKYKDTDHVISVAILEAREIPLLNKKIPSNMNLELNVSCPNVSFINSSKIDKNLKVFLNGQREWCIIKLSPTVDIKLIDFYYKEGFRQFHCLNTIPVSKGGLSGKKIMEINKKIIPLIKKKYPDTHIIAGGGITSIEDIKMYRELGADSFSFSTVFFNPFKAYHLYNRLFKN